MCKGGGAGGMAHSLPRATIVALPLCLRVAPWVDAGRVGIAVADHTGAVRGVCCRTSCRVARRRHAASSDAGVHGGHVGDEVVHAGGVAVLCGGARRGVWRPAQHRNPLRNLQPRTLASPVSPCTCLCWLSVMKGHAGAPAAWPHGLGAALARRCPGSPLSYQDTSLTKVGDSMMPAPLSTMEERVSPTKSVDTTASSVKLRGRRQEAAGRGGRGGRAAQGKSLAQLASAPDSPGTLPPCRHAPMWQARW